MAFKEEFNLITNVTASGVDKYKRDLDGAKKSLSGFEGQTEKAQKEVGRFGQAMTIASGIITARLIRSAVQWTTDAIKMGAQVGTLRGAFEALTDNVNENVLSIESLQEATRGMIPDIDLFKSANLALNLGLPIEGLNQMYESALIVGNALGITATQAVSDLTRALGRQSTLILDNLGVSLRLNEAYEIYAQRIGKVVSELTDQEKKTAFATVAIEKLNEKAALLDDTMSGAQISIQQGSAAIKNFQTTIGEAGASVAPFFLDPWTSALNILMGRQKAWWMSTDETLDDVKDKYEETVVGVQAQFDDFGDALDDAKQHLSTTFGAMTVDAAAWAEEMAGYIDDPALRRALAGEAFDEYWENQKDAFDESIADLVTYNDEYYDTSLSGLDKTFNLLDSHYDELRNAEKQSYDGRLDEVNRFYDDMIGEQQSFLDDIWNNRRDDLDDLELTFLLEKRALREQLESGGVTEEQFQERMKALEQTYRDTRGQISEDYRIEELQAEQSFSEESEKIEQERVDAIEAANNAHLLALQAIQAEERTAFETLYADLLDIADTYGEDLGFTWEDLVTDFGLSMDGISSESAALISKLAEDGTDWKIILGLMGVDVTALEELIADSTDEMETDFSDMFDAVEINLDDLNTYIEGTIININDMLESLEDFPTLEDSIVAPPGGQTPPIIGPDGTIEPSASIIMSGETGFTVGAISTKATSAGRTPAAVEGENQGSTSIVFEIGTFIGLNEESARTLANATAKQHIIELERRGMKL